MTPAAARTHCPALAWNRTALLVLRNAVLVVRSGWLHGHVPMTLLGLLLGAGSLLFAYSVRHKRALLSAGTPAGAACLVQCLHLLVLVRSP